MVEEVEKEDEEKLTIDAKVSDWTQCRAKGAQLITPA